MSKEKKFSMFDNLGVQDLTDQLRIGIMLGQISYIDGPPGVGKTQIVYQLAEEADMHPLCFMVSEMLPEDFGGIVAADLATSTAVRLMPDIVNRMHIAHQKTGKKILAFFDEINNGSALVFSACMKLLHEGHAAGYHVPEGTRFIAAGNPPESSSVANELPAPLFNRMSTLYYGGPRPDEFETHAINKGFHPAVVAFIKLQSNYLIGEADFTEGGPQPTPRSWEATSDALKLFDTLRDQGNHVSAVTRMLAIASRVGESAAKAIEATLKYGDKLVPWEVIKADPKKAPVTEDFVPAFMQVINILSRIKDRDDATIGYHYCSRLPAEVRGVFVTSLLRRPDAHTMIDMLSMDDARSVNKSTSKGAGLRLKGSTQS